MNNTSWDIEVVNHAMKRAIDCFDSRSDLLDPIQLGLFRGDCVTRDIAQLRSTRVVGNSRQQIKDRISRKEGDRGITDEEFVSQSPSKYAQKYATFLSDIHSVGRINAHVYLISVSQLALGNRIGSVCVEKLDLIGRQAASTYLEYTTDRPPLAILTQAVDKLGVEMTEESKDEFFEELLVAASWCSYLVASLART
jgi:hypothetical protein